MFIRFVSVPFSLRYREIKMSSEGSESEYGESDGELETAAMDNRESTNATNPLPESSKDKYMAVYNTFLTWKESKLPDSSFSESVLMEYFVELNAKVKPSTLWSHYSMLKSTLKFLHDVDISHYTELLGFIKKENEGFISTKAKELTSEDIQRFLTEAPDREYLATKVNVNTKYAFTVKFTVRKKVVIRNLS